MDNQQYGKLFSFIWNIANDVLVHAFEKGDYKKIILPFTVLRRIDVLLEATKPQVAAKKAFCDQNKLPYEAFLPQVTGYPFYNTSAFTMSTLKNEIDPQRLKMNVLEYFNGFSPDVQDVIDKFQLRHWVDALTNKGRLGSILKKEVKPYDAEATFGEPAIGYEISFTKHFYKPVELRSVEAIAAEIAALEKANDGLLKEILG